MSRMKINKVLLKNKKMGLKPALFAFLTGGEIYKGSFLFCVL